MCTTDDVIFEGLLKKHTDKAHPAKTLLVTKILLSSQPADAQLTLAIPQPSLHLQPHRATS